jgi:hypothetical protein
MLRRVIPLLSAALLATAAQAQGLGLRANAESPLQARINLLASDTGSGSRLLGAQLLGDYYLIGQGSGLRLSGGLMVGPLSLLGSGAAPTTKGGLGLGQRKLLGGQLDETTLNQPYLGIGFSRYGSAWGFSADLGVAVSGDARGLRLGSTSAFAQSLDDSMRRLQWTPMLQMGLSYRF